MQGLPTGAVPLLELMRHAGAPFCPSLWENKSGEAGEEVVAWPGLGFKGCLPVLEMELNFGPNVRDP